MHSWALHWVIWRERLNDGDALTLCSLIREERHHWLFSNNSRIPTRNAPEITMTAPSKVGAEKHLQNCRPVQGGDPFPAHHSGDWRGATPNSTAGCLLQDVPFCQRVTDKAQFWWEKTQKWKSLCMWVHSLLYQMRTGSKTCTHRDTKGLHPIHPTASSFSLFDFIVCSNGRSDISG